MAEPAAPKGAEDELLRMTADVVAAYVSNNTLATAQLADVIHAVYNSLRGLEGQVAEAPAEPLKPAVPIRKSITPEYLVCLEDGKKLKMLKRHLRSTYNMTPDDYRTKWGFSRLPDGSAEIRRTALGIRKKIGLGPWRQPPSRMLPRNKPRPDAALYNKKGRLRALCARFLCPGGVLTGTRYSEAVTV